MFPELTGGFLTTGPAGKSAILNLNASSSIAARHVKQINRSKLRKRRAHNHSGLWVLPPFSTTDKKKQRNVIIYIEYLNNKIKFGLTINIRALYSINNDVTDILLKCTYIHKVVQL